MNDDELETTLLLAALAVAAGLVFREVVKRVELDKLMQEVDEFRASDRTGEFYEWLRENTERLRREFESE